MNKKGILLVVFVLLFTLVGCQSDEKKLDEAFENTENVSSARVDLTMDNVPLFGTIAGYMMFNGDQIYTSFFGEQSYELQIDGVTYELIEFDGNYYAQEADEQIEDILDDETTEDFTSMYEDFNSEDFELQDDGYYHATVDYDEMTDIKIKVDDGYLSEIIATIDSEGYVMDLTMEFSDYNTTTIDFPEYEMMNDYILSITTLTDRGYEYITSDTEIRFEDWSEDISYLIDTDYFTIEDWYQVVVFYPETQMVIDGENPIQSLENYMTNEDFPIVDQDTFDMLTTYYNALD